MVAWTRSMPRQAPNSPGVNGLGSGAPSRSSAPLDSIPELLDIRKYFGYCLRTANNVAPREGRLAMTTTTAQYTVLAANDGLRLRLLHGRSLPARRAPAARPPQAGGDDPRRERALQGEDRRGDLRTR